MTDKMNDIIIRQMPAFKKAYKKLHANQKRGVNVAIKAIIKDPSIGEQKRGDLAGVFVYKFKINQQQMLLAYEWNPKERLLLALGVHENFYRGLEAALSLKANRPTYRDLIAVSIRHFWMPRTSRGT